MMWPFQSALRMRGLFNLAIVGNTTTMRFSFNPPCGCVAFSTVAIPIARQSCREFQSALRMRGLFNIDCCTILNELELVSIRLADAWPFQPRQIARAGHNAKFQSALRMRGLFNCPLAAPGQARRRRFNPPCGCVAFSTWINRFAGGHALRVSIRLADAWPFQQVLPPLHSREISRFNPPCGCVAFSTVCVSARRADRPHVSIRLADAWPFQLTIPGSGTYTACFNPPCGCVAFSTWDTEDDTMARIWLFQSALRMRGLFNASGWSGYVVLHGFQSALRMRGLFNDGFRCGAKGGGKQFQSALRMRGLFNIDLSSSWPVSYTHLTLPTIYSV